MRLAKRCCQRETDRVEQLRIQILNFPGDWYRQRCSRIGGSCWQNTWLPCCQRQRDWTFVHNWYWRTSDRPRTTTDSWYCRRQSARFAHASGPNSKESHQCLRHVCSWTSSRFRLRQQQQRCEPCGKTSLRNRVWELEIAVIPKTENEEILTNMQEQYVEELGLFGCRSFGRKTS